MLPRRQEYVLNLKAGEKTYILEYQEATAEETQEFLDKVVDYKGFVSWFVDFIAKLDSLNKQELKEIIKIINEDPDNNVKVLLDKIMSTKYRFYGSKYHWRKLPKQKWQKDMVSCDASTELMLSNKTWIPVDQLNKRLTMYQKGWLVDWILCDVWNSNDKGIAINKQIWGKVRAETKVWQQQKDKIDDLRAKMAALDAKKK